jgi:NADH-quinone oxidoreductase subunit N
MNLDSLLLLRFESVITLIILLLIIMKLTDADLNIKRFLVTVNVLLGINFLIGILPMVEGSLFTGFFKTSNLIIFEKNVLNLGLLLISMVSYKSMYNCVNRIEFYILLLSSMLGIFTMLSAGHILVLYLGIEMSTIPLAAVANFNKNMKNSSEAGIKLILSSAFSTGIMLFGISLLYGAVGNLSFESVMANVKPDYLTIMAFTFILAGFAFKMSVVPFHFWTADVYEGSPVSVTNYLSVISKASIIFVIITILYNLFGNLKDAWLFGISLLAMLSMTIGNLFALRQDNIKRLLAFSSIAQVGFVLVGIAGASKLGLTSSIYFVIIYMLSNIAAFGVVSAIVDSTGQDSLQAYKGLYKSNRFYALILAISMFSLAGIPPTAGFFGKLFLLTSGMGNELYLLLGIAAINLVLSLYNYIRVIRIMFIDQAETEMILVPKYNIATIALILCIIGILTIGFISPIFQYIDKL